MAGAEDEAAEQFYATMRAVQRHFDVEDFEAALPLCVKAFDMQPDNAVVRRCRVFTLLSLSQWAEALQVCENFKDDKQAWAFEKAYCLYRLNRFQEALDTLAAAGKGQDDRRSQRLEAQVRYRMGDYEACAQMYEKLYEEDSEEVGPLVNALASRVSGERSKEALDLMAARSELLDSSYELCFNLSCALIDEGRLGEAEARLQEAKSICVNELIQAEDLTDNEAELFEDHEELAAIHVQRACVLQRRGSADEAGDLYSRVLRQRAGQDREVDVTVLAVACNNTVTLRSEGKSLFDSLKRINIASKESLEHKLTRRQTIEIAINKCLLLLQAHKVEEARKELEKMQASFPDHPRVAIVQATLARAEKKSKACEEVLEGYLARHPGSEEVLLALAQLHAQGQRLDKAMEAISQLPLRRRAQPKTVEAGVALCQKQRNPERAVKLIREALEYWTAQSRTDNAEEETFAAVLRIAAKLAMRLQDQAFAAEVFRLYLEKIDGSDVEALCGLVQALATTDVQQAEQYALRLKVPSYDHLDPEELENVAIPKVGAASKRREKGGSDAAKDGADGGDGKARAKKKRVRKRKIRYPKNFDPEHPGPLPDPERWLPKRERTEFKKRMRKRDKALARGPQGATVTDDNAFRKQGPSTAQVEVAKDTTSRNKGRKKQGKK